MGPPKKWLSYAYDRNHLPLSLNSLIKIEAYKRFANLSLVGLVAMHKAPALVDLSQSQIAHFSTTANGVTRHEIR